MSSGALFQVKGDLVGLPPTGQVAYFTDASGNYKQVTSAGVVSSVGGGGFGADTVIQQLNSTPALVNTLELINTLTVNTAGSETATWTVKVPLAGAQINAQVITGTGTLFPAGTNAVASVQVADSGSGIMKGTSGGNYTGVLVDGNLAVLVRAGDVQVSGSFHINNGGHGVLGTVSADSSVNNMALTASFGGNPSDVVIGTAVALATNATGGFLQVPTCAGTPTGTVHLNTGKAALVLDTTANKLWLSSTAGTWKGVVIA